MLKNCYRQYQGKGLNVFPTLFFTNFIDCMQIIDAYFPILDNVEFRFMDTSIIAPLLLSIVFEDYPIEKFFFIKYRCKINFASFSFVICVY